VSEYANSRQRLSVQSLLLQADFVDDSDQIAIPPLRYRTSASSNSHPAMDTGQTSGIGAGRARPVTDVPALDDRMSMDDLLEETATPPGSDGTVDMGIDLNPWMGFAGKEDIYGMPGLLADLDGEY
jgi:hypothetical protein